jgi:8-oxo-dGTP diphosphatase
MQSKNKNKSKDTIFEYRHPFVTTDAVVFALKTETPDSTYKLPITKLRIMLYKREKEPYNGKWCLPGGFLDIDELPEDNIRRKLAEKLHVTDCYLEQLYTFCDIGRDPRARVLSICYLGLMSEADVNTHSEMQGSWFTVEEVEEMKAELGFDHYTIIRTALSRLQGKLEYTDIVFRLLPGEFTLTQLQNVFNVILSEQKQYRAAHFRRKIADLVQETGKLTSEGRHRPAKLYKRRTNHEKQKTVSNR